MLDPVGFCSDGDAGFKQPFIGIFHGICWLVINNG